MGPTWHAPTYATLEVMRVPVFSAHAHAQDRRGIRHNLGPAYRFRAALRISRHHHTCRYLMIAIYRRQQSSTVEVRKVLLHSPRRGSHASQAACTAVRRERRSAPQQ